MTGALFAIAWLSVGLLTKAVLEATYFQDRESAKRTLAHWGLLVSGALCALVFSLIFYYLV